MCCVDNQYPCRTAVETKGAHLFQVFVIEKAFMTARALGVDILALSAVVVFEGRLRAERCLAFSALKLRVQGRVMLNFHE